MTRSGNIEEPQPAKEETVAGDNIVDGGPGVSSTTRTKMKEEKGKSSDNGSVEEIQSANDETEAGDNIVDGGPGVSSTTRTKKEEKELALEGNSSGDGSVEEIPPVNDETAADVYGGPEISSTTRTKIKEEEKKLLLEGKSSDSGGVEEIQPVTDGTAAGDNIVDGGPGVSTTTRRKTKKEKKSLEGKSSDKGGVQEIQPANGDAAAEDNVFDGVPNVQSADRTELQKSGKQSSVTIVVEDHSLAEQTSADQHSDEVDRQDFRGVRQLAQRIDDAASKRTSTVAMRPKKQVRSEPGRPPTRPTSTPYDFTLNETQREWTLRAAYSDYHALAKLLSRNQGNDIKFRKIFSKYY